jgi:hypothetical protein
MTGVLSRGSGEESAFKLAQVMVEFSSLLVDGWVGVIVLQAYRSLPSGFPPSKPARYLESSHALILSLVRNVCAFQECP